MKILVVLVVAQETGPFVWQVGWCVRRGWAQRVGQHVLMVVHGAVLALVVRQ